MNDAELESLFERADRQGRAHLDAGECVDLLMAAGWPGPVEAGTDGGAGGFSLRLLHCRAFGPVIELGPCDAAPGASPAGRGDGGAPVTAPAGLIDAAALLAAFPRTGAGAGDAGAAAFDDALTAAFAAVLDIAARFSPARARAPFVITALELERCAFEDGGLSAAGCRCTFERGTRASPAKPVEKIHKMLHPASIGVIGVSATKMNFGRIILKNIVASGYDRSRMVVIRPGEEEIEGVPCVDALASLESRLDLLVVALGADAVFDLVDEVLATDAAESVMLIPGGLGETEASREPARAMLAKIDEARAERPGGPVFLGGNCLGIVSHPGGYDTWFIPAEKLPKPRKRERRNGALVSQSGAFMITRLSKNPWIDPAYMVALGNQNDLGHGDLMGYFADHEDIEVIGFYIEGFRELDGLAFARAVDTASRAGKRVIVHKAGRTAAGQAAALGHTASIAGDFGRCKAVLERAGAIVTNDLDEFTDLFYLATALHHKRLAGNRVAAVTGAGFEAVALADGLEAGGDALEMAELAPATVQRLGAILRAKRLDALMEIRNPLDINPGADDEAHLQCIEALADDPGVDLIVAGLDPLSPVTKTLERSSRPGVDIGAPDSMVEQLPVRVAALEKPVIAFVEGGALYQPMVERLMDRGVCTFRSCSRGMRALVRYTASRLAGERARRDQGGAGPAFEDRAGAARGGPAQSEAGG